MTISSSSQIARFVERIAHAAPLLVLTGAGVSLSCGIPTYRDAQGRWLRSAPITQQEFTSRPRQRQRYWGRAALGWPAVRDARPGPAHRQLAALEAAGCIEQLVTQNVDRLHQRAGSRRVIDLHGRLDRVRCLNCGALHDRDAVQAQLLARNPTLDRPAPDARPDGDADLSEDEVDRVQVPSCTRCGGVLMPDVVFFGGNIPAQRRRAGEQALTRARGLLVVGSSLQVYSGYRYCREAGNQRKPLFIINPGDTRADALADHKLSAAAEDVLPDLMRFIADSGRAWEQLDEGSRIHRD